jgi:hypothetical protein
MRLPSLLVTAAFVLSVLMPAQARAISVSASAWSYDVTDSHTGPAFAAAAIGRTATEAPGEGHASSSAVFGTLGSQASIRGCGIAVGFQAVCNDAIGSSAMLDTLFVTADLPYSWPILVRVTLALSGEVDGHGGYSYDTRATLEGQTRAISGTTSGTVQVVNHLSIADTRVFDATIHVGYSNQLSHTLSTEVLQRLCAGGTQDCFDSANNWTIGAGANATVRIEVLTQGVNAHLTSASGRNYAPTTTGVGRDDETANRLSPAWPNPARNEVSFALTLARDANVDAAVFDVAGKRIATLASGRQDAGTHTLTWNGRDAGGASRSGMYFLRVRGEGFNYVRGVMIVR